MCPSVTRTDTARARGDGPRRCAPRGPCRRASRRIRAPTWPAGTAPAPGPDGGPGRRCVGRGSCRPTRRERSRSWCDLGRPGPRARHRGRPARAARAPGRAGAARCAIHPSSTARARERRVAMRSVSSAMSGTTRLAASVGVDARRSATRSSSGWSGSCPIAETTGVRVAKTARISPSSENGRRSSTDPPPRAMTMTSTVGSCVEPAQRLDDLARGLEPLDCGVLDPEGHRRPPPPGVLEHVALCRGVAGR